MLKRNSMFIRVLTSVMIVMLLQTVIISFVLLFNGTLSTLEEDAEGLLIKNAENRHTILENTMVKNWSNLDKVESDVLTTIEDYMVNSGEQDIQTVLKTRESARTIIQGFSNNLVPALRLSVATGIFVYFADPITVEELNAQQSGQIECFGMYLRDQNPFLTPSNNEDLEYIRGFNSIAIDMHIEGNNSEERLTMTPTMSKNWNCLYSPYQAAANNPKLASKNLSYWGEPMTLNEKDNLSYPYLSYNRPLIYKNNVIGILGVEYLISDLPKNFFPENDFSNFGNGGYVLAKYDASVSNSKINCTPYVISGTYLANRFLHDQSSIALQHDNETLYTINIDKVKAHASVHPLRLYNTNTPFSNEQWALISIVTDDALFASSANLIRGLVISSLISFVIGTVLIAITIRYTTRPLISLSEQVGNSNFEDSVVTTKTNIHEIKILGATINTMMKRRKIIEAELREEREKYLIALESVADTFMEYDLQENILKIYRFMDINHTPSLSSTVISNLKERIVKGEACPKESIQPLISFLCGETQESLEIRLRAILSSEENRTNDYNWYNLKSSAIYDDDGNIKKVMIIAKDITIQKEKEIAEKESTLRDPTTRLYNSETGVSLVKQRINRLNENEQYTLCLLEIFNFSSFEARYGRVFGSTLLFLISKIFVTAFGEKGLYIRLDNDKFLFYNANLSSEAIKQNVEKIIDGVANTYCGENQELTLMLSFGIHTTKNKNYESVLNQINIASQWGIKNKQTVVYYDEIPPEVQNSHIFIRENPINTFLTIDKDNIISYIFDIFERTKDIQSIVTMILTVLGELFDLHQIIISTYDNDFDVNQVAYQYNSSTSAPYHTNKEKIERSKFIAFEKLLDENGIIEIRDKKVAKSPLLSFNDNEVFNALGCAMYENMTYCGIIIYKMKDQNQVLSAQERYCLYEVTKIISSQLSVLKSYNASKAKSEFLSRMSHEIRTPMNAIIGMTNIAKLSLNDLTKVQDCLDKIDFSSHHLLSLINDILDMSKIESGKLKINNEPFSLINFTKTVDTLMGPSITNNEINFVIDTNINHPNVIGDEYRLRQVIVNFLSNANKFTPKGGEIVLTINELECTHDSAVYYFSVKDTGHGISKEDQKNIFQAFEQANDQPVKRHDGTGLGLAISSSIINAMHSKIELESQTGEGSNFAFKLELVLDKNVSIDEVVVEQNFDNKILEGKRILLAEDNEINIEIAQYILLEGGLIVEVARNGAEAVKMFTDAVPDYYDLILMDIQMPILDGLNATRQIRRSAHVNAKTIPIVAMTANAFDEDMKKSIDSGMNGHIAKPIEVEKLFALMITLFNTHKGA